MAAKGYLSRGHAGIGSPTPHVSIKTYRDLVVWDKAMDLVVATYGFCDARRLPRFFALIDQLQRAAASVPANIAEGYGRRSRGDYMRYVAIANGSRCEAETYLLMFRRIDPGSHPAVDRLLEMSVEVARMLTALHRALKNSPAKP